MTKKQKRMLLRIGLSILLFIAAWLTPAEGLWKLVVFLIPYGVIGYDILKESVENILKGQVFDENFLMSLATIGAFAIGEYPEATFVMLFYQVGEWFQGYAVGKSRRSISELMDIRPETAHVERDGEVLTVSPEDLQIGDIIVIKPGERVPADGVLVQGYTTLDTAALTGESLPRDANEGDMILSGCLNGSGVVRVRVEKAYADSTVQRILELVENASGKKAKAEHFITRFARVYTPAVVIAAVLLAFIPLLFGQIFEQSLRRALIFLVISCPCALVISVPLSFFGGIGGAARHGVLVKGSNYLEALSRADTAVFDKTGTLTQGTFKIVAIHPNEVDEKHMLDLAVHAESYSTHPIASSVRERYQGEPDLKRVSDVREIAGQGIEAKVDGRLVLIGNDKLMQARGIAHRDCHRAGTILHMALENEYLGHIVIADKVKPGAKKAVADLHGLGVRRVVMLTGDEERAGLEVAKEIGISEAYCGLLPGDKVDKVESLLSDTDRRGTLVFIGDGINDAPVLSRADVGVAMGALGSDAAIEAADIVLMDDKPEKLALAMRLSRKTIRIVKQNIIFALGVKLLVMAMGALGVATLWEATFADVGVSVLAVLNAMRAMRVKQDG